MFCTYVHLRPDGTPFYVGKGLQGRSRQLFRSRNEHHRNIVNKYGSENIVVRVVKQNLSESEAFAHERTLIECLRLFDYKLTNMTDGGEGFRGGRHTPEWKAALSDRVKGNTYRIGKKDSIETKALKHSVLIGNKRRLGVTLSDGEKEKKRQMMLTNNPMNDPLLRAKAKARLNDPEVKARKSASMKLAWARRKLNAK